MTRLTDKEICEQVAAIEGIKLEPSEHGSYYKTKSTIIPYNPLVDDALAFRLMEKHRPHLMWSHRNNKWCWMDYSNGYFQDVVYLNSNLNKAICLAIIGMYGK